MSARTSSSSRVSPIDFLIRQAPIGAIALTAYDPLEDEDGRGGG